MDLNNIRQRIDDIDTQIISLFKQRFDTVCSVYEIKAKDNSKIFDKDREEAVLSKLKQKVEDCLKNDVEHIYSLVMDLSKNKQQIMRMKDKGYDKTLQKGRFKIEKQLNLKDVYRFLDQVKIYDVEVLDISIKKFQKVFDLSLTINICDYNLLVSQSFIDMVEIMFF